ncbi:hypothetical protein HOU03_gp159 [Caulobacter phage CcrSC]|uniref:Uncharacterized protein n=1 Tax=Caulobacter phage CcrSC TaxID=2283272 RepID=A0A385EH04_9CAUD|nr:hypothetical protein HOU03_gp027 [Caulobacter phage CcrSC]YP_009810739.1 hypothetical protein HOU03_gp159 [Caulobacter phage CcrSC]AXQ69609.1 hypothetical protein CcrSC_gp027 [Caulobacter phage CcrSC]AXQ70109.1 hypothetical protein CcrSC_gp527 [Caulobacter phage CcrSC]
MASYVIQISVNVEVDDLPVLLAAAMAKATGDDGLTEDQARDILTNSDPLGRPDVKACLTMLFDPGVSPDGTSINDSIVTREDYDQDEAMDAYEAAHGEDEEGEGDDED